MDAKPDPTRQAARTPASSGLLAAAIASRRIELGWTQQELAELAGLTRRTVSRGETGLPLTPRTRLALEKALETTLPGKRPVAKAILPRTAIVGKFLREIRLGFPHGKSPKGARRDRTTLAIAAQALFISPSQLSRLERGLAAPRNLFAVEGPEGDIVDLETKDWRSAIYGPHLAKIRDLASGDGRKGRFRD
ncbi:helix-turn-helix transcriptional regulator [Sphingomonas sp. R86521]|uniref:helix-turn-helix transcriptional regulator n=1 Tax=Sphingomonas sp. R86521 TaxID=3093860 RepID=UPI0036D227B4